MASRRNDSRKNAVAELIQRVLVYSPPDDVVGVHVDVESDFDALDFSSKKPVGVNWRPVPVHLAFHDYNRPHVRSNRVDFPNSNFGGLALSERAKVCLEPLLSTYGELLPLACPDEPLWALNITKVIDALDLERSVILDRPTMNPMCPNVVRCAFDATRTSDAVIFRLPQTNVSEIFFTDKFVEEVRRHELTGFGYRVEWKV
jgi:hypothetical protein